MTGSLARRLPDGRPLIFGEVLFDYFPDGNRVLGGAPFNVAWHLQAFGESPLLVSRVGDDESGREIRSTMNRWGMSTLGLQQDPQHGTGEVRIALRDGQPTFDIVKDRAFDHIDAAGLPVLEVSLVYHGSLALRGLASANALDTLLDAADAPVFVDVNLRPPWWSRSAVEARLGGVRWLKLNHEELELLAGSAGETASLATRLLERYRLELVIVTLGERGAMLVSSTGEVVEASATGSTAVVDTVGAGDALSAVCIVGLLHDWPLETLLARAQAFASLVVAQRGAVAEDRMLYRRLLKGWMESPT